MKLAIISKPSSPNTLDILRVAKDQGVDCRVYALRELVFDTDTMFDDEFFSHDVYLFRGYNKNYSLAQTLAQSLANRGKTVIDSALIGGFIPSKFHEALVYKQHGIPHIRTSCAVDIEAWQAQTRDVTYPVIVKDIDSQRGRGVRLCEDEASLVAEISQHGPSILIQEFVKIPFDIRVICIGNDVIGSIKREAAEGDFRTNVSLGGNATAYTLSDAEHALALKAHKSMGYDISGVDIALDDSGKPFVIETNITPEWQGFMQATGIDVAEKIIQYLIKKEA